MSWKEYWALDTGDEPLFYGVAEDFKENLITKYPFDTNTCLLDFGCGPGYLASFLYEKVGRIYLYDTSLGMLKKAHERNRHRQNVIIVENLMSESIAPLDYILANSVIQYMDDDEFKAHLELWHSLLKPGGKIILSDVLSGPLNPFGEIISLLRFSMRKGFFFAQILRFISLYFSNFTNIAQAHPLKEYPPDKLTDQVTTFGFECQILDQNLVSSKGRYAACLLKPKKS